MKQFEYFHVKVDYDWLSFNDESIVDDRDCSKEECRIIEETIQMFDDEFGGIPAHDKKHIGLFMGRPLSQYPEKFAFVICTDRHARIVKEKECEVAHYCF